MSLGSQGLLSDGQCINMSYKQETLPSSLSSSLTLAVSALSIMGTASQQSHSNLWACRCGHRIADERQIWNGTAHLYVYAAMLTSHTSDSPFFLAPLTSLQSHLPGRPQQVFSRIQCKKSHALGSWGFLYVLKMCSFVQQIHFCIVCCTVSVCMILIKLDFFRIYSLSQKTDFGILFMLLVRSM